MRRRALQLLMIAAGAVPILLFPKSARAIGAWSREYKTECSTCHNPFPHRNEFGEAFRRNGYVWPGRPREEKRAGSEEYAWLSGIPSTLPLSASLRPQASYDPDAEKDRLSPSTDVFVHAGGNLRNTVGFYVHDATGSGEAFGMYREALGSPVNIRFGRFAPQTTLWKEDHLFTAALPAPLAFSVSGGGNPLLTPRDGLELNAVVGSRLFVAMGVLDRKNQNKMDYAAHLSYKIGGTDLLGKQPEVNFDEESVWDFLSVAIGGFGYFGTIEQPTHETDFYRLGVETEVLYKGFTALLSAVSAHDDDVDGTGLEVDSVLLSTELAYFFAPRYLVAARFENEDVGNSTVGIVKRVIGNFTWAPLESMMLRLEGRYARDQSEGGHENTTGLLQVWLHF